MNKTPLSMLQQLMILTAEECGELTQRCSKILRRYQYIYEIEEEQREKFLEEVGDVYCMFQLLVEHDVVTWDEVKNRKDFKKLKLKTWSDL